MGSECDPWTPTVPSWTDLYVYEVGALSSVGLTYVEEIELGTGRVHAWPRGASGEVLQPGYWNLHDTLLDEACGSETVDGVSVCVPYDRESFDPHQYEDAACTQPLFKCTGLCTTTKRYELADFCGTTDLFASLRQGTEQVTADVYELDEDGNCVGPVPADSAWRSRVLPEEEWGLAPMEVAILP
jgi:hypothetical protein